MRVATAVLIFCSIGTVICGDETLKQKFGGSDLSKLRRMSV